MLTSSLVFQSASVAGRTQQLFQPCGKPRTLAANFNRMPLTKEDRINTVYGGGRHVVIIGAGASIASSLRNPELNGKQLPSMANFLDLLELNDIVESVPAELRTKNFEKFYSNLYDYNKNSKEIKEIEKRVYAYFKDMKLPDEATIYDHLVLSLRPNDLIASFNWDPFLFQAYTRNRLVGDQPDLAFLHGNVAIGYNKEEDRAAFAGMTHKITGRYFAPTKLLYPVTKKNYNNDDFTKGEWHKVKSYMKSKDSWLLTVFGYGAPESDVEAKELLNKAWGTPEKRDMEQFEIIDIRDEEEVRNVWGNFIHSHHYDYATDYFNSSLARNPRRTRESYHQHIYAFSPEEAFSKSNPIPHDIVSLKDLWEWHKPLIEAEKKIK